MIYADLRYGSNQPFSYLDYDHFTTFDSNFGRFFPLKDFAATEIGKKTIQNPGAYRKMVIETYPRLGKDYATFRKDFGSRFPAVDPAFADVQGKMEEIKAAFLNQLADPKAVQQLDLKNVDLRKGLGLSEHYNEIKHVCTEYKISAQKSYRILGPKVVNSDNVLPENSLIFQGSSDGKAPLTWSKIRGVILCRRRLFARQLGLTCEMPAASKNLKGEGDVKYKPSVKDRNSVKLGEFLFSRSWLSFTNSLAS